MIFGACMEILFIIKVKTPMLMKWSYKSPPSPQVMLIVEPRMVLVAIQSHLNMCLLSICSRSRTEPHTSPIWVLY